MSFMTSMSSYVIHVFMSACNSAPALQRRRAATVHAALFSHIRLSKGVAEGFAEGFANVFADNGEPIMNVRRAIKIIIGYII